MFDRFGPALRLTAVDRGAVAHGLAPGRSVADARARVPGLVLVERDGAAETRCLETIADWCDRFTPLVGLDLDFPGEFGLLLDVGGVTRLFGGEDALAARVVEDLAARGFGARVGVAGTGAAARAFARCGLGGADHGVIVSGEEEAVLAGLPVGAIDPDGARATSLARLGLDTVAALARLPRAALARRFGADLLARLDEALGRAERPISPRLPTPALVTERAFTEPIVGRDDVAEVVRSLGRTLAENLERRGEGVRVVELALWRVDGTVRRVTVGTGRPSRDPDLLAALFAERLKGEENEIDPGFGIDLVRLSVLSAGRDDPRQIDLAGDAAARGDFDRLIDRLGARLGTERVTRLEPCETHRPEAATVRPAAFAAETSRATRPAPVVDPEEPPDRPLRLLARPEPIETVAEVSDGPPLRFRWRRAFYEVARAEGPERIAASWWSLPPGLGPEGVSAAADVGSERPRVDPATATRDYFRVEDGTGRRFWIFRAGLFARETERPRWFLHGLFA